MKEKNVKKYIMQYVPDEPADWFRIRPADYEERTEYIQRHGLPSLIRWEEWNERDPDNPLYVIRVKEDEGFTHLYKEELREEMERRTPYHISIGFKRDYDNKESPWYRCHQEGLQRLREQYAEWQPHVFWIKDFGNATANLHWNDPVYIAIRPLVCNGSYAHKQIHISM